MTRTSVVIVAYRSLEHLRRGLPPVLADPSVGDVVVVDNSRDPATEAFISRAEGRVRYVDPGANLGFSRGCNLGASLTGDPVLTFLNPDVVLTRGLAEIADACVGDPRSIRAGGLTSGADAALANARQAVTLGVELRRTVLGSGSSLQPVVPGGSAISVDQVDGALLATSRAFFDQLGGFDERFELYFEDVDICDRGRAAGSVVLDTRVFGVHSSGASARTAVGTSYCVFRVSRVRYFAKHGGTPGALAAFLITALEAVIRTATRQPEGLRVRMRALGLSGAELVRPRRVRVLW